jgi:hypothetical protein
MTWKYHPYPSGQIKDVAMETPNPSMEGESISMFQMKGVRTFTPLQIALKVVIDPQITTLKPFNIA